MRELPVSVNVLVDDQRILSFAPFGSEPTPRRTPRRLIAAEAPESRGLVNTHWVAWGFGLPTSLLEA